MTPTKENFELGPMPAGLAERNLPAPGAPGIQPARRITVEGVAYDRFPIKVPRLFWVDDDLQSILDEYVRPHAQPGDWVVLSEKLVSVCQKRVRHISTVKVTPLARFIVLGVKKHKTMTAWSKPEKIQVAIEEAGIWRILPAMVIGALGKLVGLRGLFWTIAGNRVSEIDGFIPEDMYPYTEWAVLPPDNPQGVCDDIEKSGLPAVVTDANFINVQILGVSKGVGLDKKTVRLVLLDNPLGQGNKMTPLVLVRKAS